MTNNMNTQNTFFSFSHIPCLLTDSHFMHLYQIHHKCSTLKIYYPQWNFSPYYPQWNFSPCLFWDMQENHIADSTAFYLPSVLPLPQISALVSRSHNHQPLVPLMPIRKNGDSLFVDFSVTFYKNM